MVASNCGLHPILQEVADQFEFLGDVDDLRPYYRAATATLVPSFIVAGAKTTILQGWATGCPVVTTASAAASVGSTQETELLFGETPDEVAKRLCVLLGDPDLQLVLADEGACAVSERFGPRSRYAVRSNLRCRSRKASTRRDWCRPLVG